MGLIQNLIRKIRSGKEERASYERGRRIEENYETRKLNANERELITWQEEDRQKMIKQMLERYRKNKQHEIWSGKVGNPVYAKNIIKNNRNIFSTQPHIFNNKDNLFNQPSIFMKK